MMAPGAAAPGSARIGSSMTRSFAYTGPPPGCPAPGSAAPDSDSDEYDYPPPGCPAPGAAPPGAAPGAAAPSRGFIGSMFKSKKKASRTATDSMDVDDSSDDGDYIGSSAPPGTDMEKITLFASNQTAAGAFKAAKALIIMMGAVKYEKFEKVCEKKKVDKDKIMTAYAIAYIEMNFPKEKDTWELFVEKAKDWLKNPELIKEASQYLN